MTSARHLLVALLTAILLAACSKITAENYERVKEGMTEAEVTAILGPPTESSAMSILGITGQSSRWDGKESLITVQFVNGKVRVKNLLRNETPRPGYP